MARSLLSKLALCLASFSLPQLSSALGKTDTITWGGDTSRAGYETNHNLDPRTIASADFGNIWIAKLPGNFNGIGQEQVLSQPLVYTTGDGIQYVFVATTQNNLYKINAKTGDIVKTRNLGVPFLAADLNNCNDIAPAIGVSGTGVIDPATGLWYLTSKTYSEQFQGTTFTGSNSPGRVNGRYYFHAISTDDLSNAPNFPRPVHGTVFRNNQNRQLIAGDQHQRPALLQVGDYIYTGWASHCIQYNYTGAIIGFHKTTGAVVEAFATQGGKEPNTVPGGGVWMSGGGLAYDGAGSLFFSTGNGYAAQLPASGKPVSGRQPPTALEEAVVNMKLHDDGTMEPVDFFMPWEKTQLDGADKDLGTTPFQLLPSAFSCPNDRRIGVITGKSGKTYWLDVDNLGGYQLGPNRLDDAIQVFQNENAVYSAAGVMPLGKYIYINVINYNTRVFQFSCNANGNGQFTEVAKAAEHNAQALGVGHGTTTSLDGREGTGLYWTTDVDGQDLRIYDATPPSDGSASLKLLRGFNIPGPGKFAKPVFGDGKAYVGARGALYAFGAPVNLPLNCTSPIAFPRTSVNSTSDALDISCTANVQTQVTKFAISGNPNFVTESLPTLPLTLAPGQKFTFKARFAPKQVGSLSSDVAITTQNQAAGSASTTPVTLTGTGNSAAALFSFNPITVTFNTTFGAGPVQKSVFFNNDGDSALTITNLQYSTQSETGPWITPNTTDAGQQVAQFTFSNVPNTIPANSRVTVGIVYEPPEAGNHAVFVKATTNGGTKLLDVFGATGSAPGAFYEFERWDGTGWDPYVPGQNFTFGPNVLPGTTKSLKVRITNNGSSTASPLGLTVSKPPFGVPGFVKAANGIDLAEGTIIAAGQSANATMFCAPDTRQVNTPTTRAGAGWRINTNTDQGAVILSFDCTSAAPQVGPLLANGTAQNPYVGCYEDETPGRQLSSNPYNGDNNTAANCLAKCGAAGFIYTGMIFSRECWCGNALPLKHGAEADCTYRCTGDDQHACGGAGEAGNKHMISLFADSTKWDGSTESGPLTMVRSVNGYTFDSCYAESNNVKTFNVKRQVSNVMTVERCQQYCAGSQLFGLQYAQECYCGASIAASSKATLESDCSYTCKGNNSQYCGGSQRMQVYRLGTGTSTSTSSTASATGSATPAPEVDGVSSRIGSYRYQGCYNDVPGRALTKSARYNDDDNTNRICATFCAGSTYFGTEYGRECYCGDTLDPAATVQTDGRCSMPCNGNNTEICGGEQGLTLFKLDPSLVSSSSSSSSSTQSATSTQTDTSSISTTSSASTTTSTAPVSTPLVCPGVNGTTYASNGKSWKVECGIDYPGNDMGSVGVADNSLNACIDACAARDGCVNVALSGARCYLKKALGNPVFNGINGARLLPAVVTTTSSSTSSSSSSTSSGFTTITTTSSSSSSVTSTSSSSSSVTSTSSSATSTDSSTSSSSAVSSTTSSATSSSSSSSTDSSSSTASSQTTTSSSSSSTSSQATTSSSSSSTSSSSTTSSSPTSTSSTLTTSSTTSAVITTTSSSSSTSTGPTVAPAAATGLYNSLGCYSDQVNGVRTLTEVYTNKTMTVEMCASEAKRRSYEYMGLEFGQECWLGAAINSSSSSIAQSKCSTVCPGNNTNFCGGSKALQMYRLNSTLAEPKKNTPSGPLVCPGSDDTIYTASNGQSKFRLECGWDRTGGSSSTVTAASWEACIEACVNKTGCGSVALNGKNCYLKTGALGTQVRNDKIRGATLIVPK